MQSPFTHQKPAHASNGFTLIELLVVILIIAALAAITFTALARIKKSANQAITTGNMRQIGVALASFSAENNRFPSQIGDPVWDRAIMTQLGQVVVPTGNGSIKRSAFPALQGLASIFTTPEDKEKRDPSVYQRSFAIVPWTTNWSNGTAFRGWKDRPFSKGIPNSALIAPEKAAMVVQWYSGDSGIANLLGHGNHAYHDMGGPPKALGPQQQVLFADGHIEKIPANITNAEFVKRYWPGSMGNIN